VADAQRSIEERLHGLIERSRGKDAATSLDSLKERLLTFETYLSEPTRKTIRR
jgi:hypothetical protein